MEAETRRMEMKKQRNEEEGGEEDRRGTRMATRWRKRAPNEGRRRRTRRPEERRERPRMEGFSNRKRLAVLTSHAADRSKGKTRKMLLIDVKKAHLNSECTEDVFIELPEEVVAAQDRVGKLRLLALRISTGGGSVGSPLRKQVGGVGFRRGLATPLSFYHEDMDVNLVVHG